MQKTIVAFFLVVICLVTGIPESFAQHSLPYSTGFEDVKDWSMPRPAKGAIGYGWQYNSGSHPPPMKADGTYAFDMFRVGATLFDPSNVTPAYIVGNQIGRNGGRGMQYNVEVSGIYGTSGWTGGSPFGLWLGTAGYPDIYLRFYAKYPSQWKWNDTSVMPNTGAIQKMAKVAVFQGTPGDGKMQGPMAAPAYGGEIYPAWIPTWFQYLSVTPSYNLFNSQERYAPNYTAPSVTDFYTVSPQYYPVKPPVLPNPSGHQARGVLWPTDGQWHCYELHARMNSAPGVKDGLSELFIDGVKVFSKNTVPWVDVGGTMGRNWNMVEVMDNVDLTSYKPTEQVTLPMYLDDIAVDTNYSGPPAAPVNVAVQALGTTSARVDWDAGNNGATYKLDGYRVRYGTDPANLSNTLVVGSITQADVTSLVAGKTYYFSVSAFNKLPQDTNENESLDSSVVSVVMASSVVPTDTTSPTVSITSPASGATVSGVATVNVTATDNVGVSKVELYINGAVYGVYGSAPYSLAWDTKSKPNGSYLLTAKAYDAAGNLGTSSSLTVHVSNVSSTVLSDSIAPVVSITSPAASSTVKGSVTVSASATDNVGVSKVSFFVDGVLKATDTVAPFSYSWDTTLASNWAHSLSAKAYDAAGNVGSSSNLAVKVSNVTSTVPSDSIAPVVSITSPAASSTVSGAVTVSANATDNVKVSSVGFYVNGILQATSTVAPYSFAWNTATLANGAYTVSAKAYDAAGNVGLSANVAVTVSNDRTAPVVSITSPAASSTVSGAVTVSANATDNVKVSSVGFYVNGILQATSTVEPYSFAWNTATLANGAYTVNAKAYDAAGNVGLSANVAVTVSNDRTAPVVSITSPAASSTVSGAVTVSANATDNVKVSSVGFYVNGILQATSTVAPYSFTWNTAALAKGAYTVSAKAYDTAGNVGLSANVAVTVSSDSIAPVVSITSPAASAAVGGAVAVSANATDNVGVTKVEFYVNGILNGSSAVAPYSFTWGTAALPLGSYTLTTKAYDAMGNVGQSAAVAVTVKDMTPPVITILTPSTTKISGSTVAISTAATDNVAVTKMEIYLDGWLKGASSSSSLKVSPSLTVGTHVIRVVAYDAMKNVTTKLMTVTRVN